MIKEFETIAERYDVPSGILNKIETDISGDGSREVHLTSLQKETIENEQFWGSPENRSNLIIQGATSSGKTLVAELLALQCVYSLHKHVIYLVPLRALVSEKEQQLKKHVYNSETSLKINIFASSSDYQDHDAELAEGQYDIAVIVYEKFFAMLAEQKDNKLLEKCGLIIVDEIQLLGSQDRGAKLEYALTKVLNNYRTSIRILGLTTIDCETSYVRSWLGAEIIKNSHRPIGLKERVISLNGLYWERQIAGETDLTGDENPDGHTDGKIETGEIYDKNRRLDAKKSALMFSLLKKINSEDKEKKIIVFTSSRGRCRNLSKNIANSGVFEYQDINEQLRRELEKIDDESEKSLFQNELLPYGIAYHSSALPTSLRELIEREFKNNNGSIKLIVATETITIGVNLPADIMILYDHKVYRGSEGSVELKAQEYKNYIGRAGRLGITDKIGESYLFVDSETDISYYWKTYVQCQIEEVSSALKNANARECAPYYLNLLCKGTEGEFTEDTILELADKTLNAAEIEDYTIDTANLIRDLRKVQLITESDPDELDEDDQQKYRLTSFGEMLAPYALSVRTCLAIKNCFRDDGGKNFGGLPLDYSGEDLKKDKYLLDILYVVCKMEEVNRISQPRLPDSKNDPHNRKAYQIYKDSILEYLQNHKEQNGEDAFWERSELSSIIDDDIEDIEADKLKAALRAILLFHWIKGELPSEMKEEAGFNKQEIRFYTGDMARVGESCSYIIEAISKCFFTNKKRKEETNGLLEHNFYQLSLKLKYGLAEKELLNIANRHVHGLSRSAIIQMGKESRECGFDNINYFIRSGDKKIDKYLTENQRTELIRQMSERYLNNNVDNLIDKSVEDGIIDFALDTVYRTLAHPTSSDEWKQSLTYVLASFENISAVPIKGSSTYAGFKLTWGQKELEIILMYNHALVSDTREFWRNNTDKEPEKKIMFLYNRVPEEDIGSDHNIYIASDYLCIIILEVFATCGSAKADILFDYLYTREGVVCNKGIRSLQEAIEGLILQNKYEKGSSDEERDAYERYLDQYHYIDEGIMEDAKDGHALMHKVIGSRDTGTYAIKQVIIPESETEFQFLQQKAQELYERYGDDIDTETLKSYIRKSYESYGRSIDEKGIDEIIKNAQERKNQVDNATEEREFYFFQSIVFRAEGYRRLSEARIAAKLSGNNIVSIHNPDIYFSDYEDAPELNYVDKKFNGLCSNVFFAMELYDGNVNDKSDVFREQSESVKELGIQICKALNKCHSKEILHRDIKPNNILYRHQDEYALSDFGSAAGISDSKTRGIGTESYMAPEVYDGDYSVRSDIYSLGRTLWYLYKGDFKNQEEDELSKVLSKAISKEPMERYQSASDFMKALESLS